MRKRHARVGLALEEREPALITLSEPLPTIPVLGPLLTPILDPILDPLLTPLIAGLHATSSSATVAPTTTLAATTQTSVAGATTTSPSAPATSSGNSGSNGSSGSNSDGSGGSSADAGSSNANSATPGPEPSSQGASASSGALSVTGSATIASGASAISTSASSSGLEAGSQSASDAPGSGVVSPSGSTSFQLAAAVGEATGTDSNGQPLFTYSDPVSGTKTSISAAATAKSGSKSGSGSSSGVGSGVAGNGGDRTDGNGGSVGGGGSGSVSKHHGLSVGAIVGIVVAVTLLAAALAVFLMRRRLIKKRSTRRKNWWRGGPITPDDAAVARASIRSSTSSFGTPFDGQGPLVPIAQYTPPYTPTSASPFRLDLNPGDSSNFTRSLEGSLTVFDSRRTSQTDMTQNMEQLNSQGVTFNAALPARPPQLQLASALRTTSINVIPDPVDVIHHEAQLSPRRSESESSASADEKSTQYHTAKEDANYLLVPITPLTPVFSPTASSQFHGRSESSFSRNSTEEAEMDARWAEERRRLSWISQVSVRPFTPSESFAFPKPPGSEKTKGVQTATHSPQASIASVPETSETNDTYHTAVAVSSESPFADPTELKNPFLDVVHLKPIKRSYIPYRGDELGVQRGEDVSVLKYFGDGWALVERSLNGVVETGLIPQACFQDA